MDKHKDKDKGKDKVKDMEDSQVATLAGYIQHFRPRDNARQARAEYPATTPLSMTHTGHDNQAYLPTVSKV
ncbi:hypothetical protein BGZ94_009216, partial [Podila epigama]